MVWEYIRCKILSRIVFLSLVVISLGTFLNCAKRGFPPGGPKDLTPPKVLEVSPEDNSLNVNLTTEIILTFSEKMDRESTEKSIFITPIPETAFEFKWKKNTLTLKPSEVLEQERTYVITIGTNAQDLHNNKMEKSFSTAFSTGNKLNSGFIEGRVFLNSNLERGVSIWCYSLSKSKEPDPQKDMPVYVTLSGEDGGYRLSYLAEEHYRLFAVKDLNGDLLWNPEKEPLGIATKDLNLAGDSLFFSHIDFNLVLRDFTSPALLDCQSLDRNKLRLDFDEPLSLKLDLLENENYRIISDSLPGESLKVKQIYIKEKDYKKAYLITEEMRKIKYKIHVENLFDLAGNPMDKDQKKCVFWGTEEEDKAPLKVIATHPKSGEDDVPLDIKIKLYFDKPPEKSLAERGFLLIDSLDQKVEGGFLWLNPAALVFVPEKPLKGETRYFLSLKEVSDLWGNSLADTSFEIAFSTLNPDTLGALSGKVENLSRREGSVVIVLEKTQGTELKYEKRLDKSGVFRFEALYPGKYKLRAYLDLNENGALDFGEVSPFEAAEPQLFYPDSLNIRSRWETEEVTVVFR